MPLYDFECSNCGYTGEELITGIETREDIPKLLECPKCSRYAYFRKVHKIHLGSTEPGMAAVLSNGEKVPGSFGK